MKGRPVGLGDVVTIGMRLGDTFACCLCGGGDGDMFGALLGAGGSSLPKTGIRVRTFNELARGRSSVGCGRGGVTF